MAVSNRYNTLVCASNGSIFYMEFSVVERTVVVESNELECTPTSVESIAVSASPLSPRRPRKLTVSFFLIRFT